MTQQYTHKNCSLDSIRKNGKTRLRLSENDLNSYLTNCILSEEEDIELFEDIK